MNIVHATTDPPLLDQLRAMLGSSSRADIAVGYFFMSGFGAIADSLAQREKVRILVGHVDKPLTEQIAMGLQQAEALRDRQRNDGVIRRSEREQAAGKAVADIAAGVSLLPQSSASEQAVAALHELVASGRVEVRAYTRGPLHAKAYLCWYDNHAEPGSAIVGSSNLTLAGFQHNTELNVRVSGKAEMDELKSWFDALWADSTDISDDLVTQIVQSWPLAETPPYHVYLKALYELYGGQIGPEEPLALVKRGPELANFQQDAVRRARHIIEEFGGCYIGDVVGLGKTYVGAGLLRELKFRYPNDDPPLIICPAGLKPMWERFNELFALGAEVVSQSVITSTSGPEFDEELEEYVDAPALGQGVILRDAYPHRGAVLVDEAHNFRNDGIRRSRGLREYLESGDHKIILMSATPQNLGPMDTYNQLRLFLDDTEHGLPIEPLSLSSYMKNAELWRNYRTEDESYKAEMAEYEREKQRGRTITPPLVKPKPPSVPEAQMESVLSPVFIRRRRRDIREVYGDTAMVNDSVVRFPTPELDNLTYRLDKVYAKAGSLSDIQALLSRHKGVRYLAMQYIEEEAREYPQYRDLFRARDRIANLMKALLFKRLESSIAAFRSTLESLMRSNRNFRRALDEGYVPIGQTATNLLNSPSFDPDQTLLRLENEERRRREAGAPRSDLVHPIGDFDITRWKDDLDADHAVLAEAHRRIADISPDDDDKLRALRNFLSRPDVQSGKVLLFSEAETTVNYLYEQLNPNGDDSEIARLSGSNRGQAADIVSRFSPNSNLSRRGRNDTQIRILLATDVVSEGQNLQDCARVINYDLHWNPVRLIQRFGRVDRIGTVHEVIRLHNLWPDTEVDAQISLTERLNRRIQSFHDFIGLDSKLLSESERLNEGAMYRIYAEKQLPDEDDVLDEVSVNQRAIALLQRIQDTDPDLWQTIENLPDGIRSALWHRGAERAGDAADSTTQTYARGGEQLGLARMITPMQAAAQATPAVGEEQLALAQASMPDTVASFFDPPNAGETLVLLAADDVKNCYAVGSDLQPRTITPAQLLAAAQCGPDTPRLPLPSDTNERVTAAFNTFTRDLSRRIGSNRRSSDNRTRRYLNRELRTVAENSAEAERVRVLRRIFLGGLPQQVERTLDEVRRLDVRGDALLARLDALRERYRLTPATEMERAALQPRVIRTVCSDGLL